MSSTALLYAAVSSHQKEDGLELIDRLYPVKNCTVLDLGCGTGFLTNVMAGLVGPDGYVVGADPDTERIRVAREAYGNTGNLQFFVGDDKHFPPGPYDVVVANQVLHWIKDKDSVFKNVFENLKIDGRFAINTGNIAQIVYDLEALLPMGKTKFSDCTFPCPLAEYDRLATKYQFLIDFHCEVPKTYTFRGIETFLEWLHASSRGLFEHHSVNIAGLDSLWSQYDKDSIPFNFSLTTCIYRKS